MKVNNLKFQQENEAYIQFSNHYRELKLTIEILIDLYSLPSRQSCV